jgi:hypothetical protein
MASVQLGIDFSAVEFAGETYDRVLDKARLTGQLRCVFLLMLDKEWHTLEGLQKTIEERFGVHYSTQGIGARLRNLRQDEFGAHDVDKLRVGESGIWKYRLTLNDAFIASIEEGS